MYEFTFFSISGKCISIVVRFFHIVNTLKQSKKKTAIINVNANASVNKTWIVSAASTFF